MSVNTTETLVRPDSEPASRPVTDSLSRVRQRNRRLGVVLLAVANPFLALLLALKYPREVLAKNLVWVFIVFYGTVFYVAAGFGLDGESYANQLRIMHETDFSLPDLASSFFAHRGAYQDFYQPIVTFLVSRFSGETWLLFGTFGIFFGYVYSRNVWFLVDRLPRRSGVVVWLLILAFAFVVGIGEGLNGVRMWTALHVFVFGVLHYADRQDPRFLLVSLLSPLVHFSFLLPSAVLLAFLLLKRFGAAIYVFFVASFFIAALDVALIRQALEYLPLTMGERAISGYVDRAEMMYGASEVRRERVWFLTLNHTLVSAFIFLGATWLFLRKAHQRVDVIRFVFLFGMLVYGGVNLVDHVPSAGRFSSIGEMLILAAFIMFLSDRVRAKKLDFQVAAMLLPLLAIHFALGFRELLYFSSIWLVAGNFFVAPFVDPQVSLFDMVRRVAF